MYLATRRTAAPAEPTAPAPPTPSQEGDRSAVVALGLTSFWTDLASEMVAAVLPLYLVARVGFDVGSYGLFDGAMAAAAIVVILVGGAVTDRTRRPKPVAVAGYAVSGVSRLGLVWAVAPVAFLLLDRVGKGLRVAPRDALIAAHAPRHALASAFAVHRALDTAGALAGPLIAFAVLQLVPGDFALLFQLSVLGSVLGIVVLVVGVPAPARTPAPVTTLAAEAPTGAPTGAATHAGRRVAAAGAVLGAATVSDGLLFLAMWRLADLDPAVFPLLFAGSAVSYLLLGIPFGRLADRIGRSRLLVPAHGALLAVYALLWATEPSGWTVAACLALHGLYYAGTDGVYSATAAAIAPPHRRGQVIGRVLFGVAAGRLVGGALFGAVWLRAGLDTALALAAGLLVLAAVAAARLLRPVHPEDR